jgi:hypothetical protein
MVGRRTAAEHQNVGLADSGMLYGNIKLEDSIKDCHMSMSLCEISSPTARFYKKKKPRVAAGPSF